MRRFILLIIAILFSILTLGQSLYCTNFKDEILIEKPHILISYNPHYKIPNYVGEHLTREQIVTLNYKRDLSFYTEKYLTVSYRSYSSNYTNSGYDRGHMAAAANYRFDKDAMYETFSMANICPQNSLLNRIYWADLEFKVRKAALQCDEIYIISGPIVENTNNTIKNKIVVPQKFFKAVIGLKSRKYILSCAWIYTNDDLCTETKLSINDLEKILNKNLFYRKNNETNESQIKGI